MKVHTAKSLEVFTFADQCEITQKNGCSLLTVTNAEITGDLDRAAAKPTQGVWVRVVPAVNLQ